MSVSYLRRCLLLQAVPGLGSRTLCALLQHYGSVDALWCSDPRRWPVMKLSPSVGYVFSDLRERSQGGMVSAIERRLELLTESGAAVICVTDAAYPPLLRAIPDPPPLLFVRGDSAILSHPQLAVVGARRASSAGLKAARELSAAAAEAGLVITSGLAQGVDGAAHRGALAGGGCSVGVMATGIEQVYPRCHQSLAGELLASGCLVSELPPGAGPRREHFPRRNRLVSGLSLGVLVIEAALPSGSLITAGTALQQHREVFTLPWSIYHPGGRGCLQLLRDGAALVQDVSDLFAELESLVSLQREWTLSSVPAPTPDGCPLLDLIGDGGATVDELASNLRRPVARILAELSQLELEGVITRSCGAYVRCPGPLPDTLP